MKGIPCILLSVSLLTATVLAQSTVTHEETVVRQAYAKISYLAQIDVITKAAFRTQNDPSKTTPDDIEKVRQDLDNGNVVFEINNVVAGRVAEIADKKWKDLVSSAPANGQILHFDTGAVSFKDGDTPQVQWTYAKPEWRESKLPGPDVGLDTVMNMPLHTVMDLGAKLWVTPDVVYSRYATFTVTAHFDNQMVGPYKAAFFFGTNAKGREVVAPEDNNTDAQALFTAMTNSAYPIGLLRTSLRSNNIVADWLDRNQISAPQCTPGKREVCCVESRCGIADTDLRTELETPIVHEPKK